MDEYDEDNMKQIGPTPESNSILKCILTGEFVLLALVRHLDNLYRCRSFGYGQVGGLVG